MCLRPKSLIQIILSHNGEVLRILPMPSFMLRLYYVKNHVDLLCYPQDLLLGIDLILSWCIMKLMVISSYEVNRVCQKL